MRYKNKKIPMTPTVKNYDTDMGYVGDSSSTRFFGPAIGSNTGMRVTPWSSLGSAPVYAAVRALSEDMARLPFEVQMLDSKGGWGTTPYHNLARLFRQPNKWQSNFDFIAFLVNSYSLRGNAYCVIIRDGAGVPITLIPLSPDRVQILVSEAGNLFYSISHQLLGVNEQVVVPSDDIIHVKGMSLDGYTGVSPITVGQEAIGLALAAQTHGAKTFANGASVGGVLQSPEKLDNISAQRMAQSWRDTYSGVQNAGRIAVLEEGVTFNRISMSLEDAQFLATRSFQVIDIARLFRVPPHKLFDLTDSHYQNATAMNQDYVDNALLPIAKRIQQEFERKLFFAVEEAANNIRIKFDFDDMLRADQETRYKTYSVGILGGILSINEVRGWEGLAAVEGGDEHTRQSQNVSITAPPAPPAPIKPEGDQ